MDYPFESLAPDVFQQVIQALITKEHPDVQCFPVGQADAGRDAVAYTSGGAAARAYLLYQVKFTRYPSEIDDPARWMISAISEEISKVEELKRRGATHYIIVTNVRGTGSKDMGTMDKVNSFLAGHCALPTMCWWRDDLARRLDGAWDIKWAYPALLSGPDILRAVLQHGLSEHVERRNNAIRTTIAHQYHKEREVRFKQVELQNPLLDLFVDSPLAPPDISDRKPTPAFFVYRRLMKQGDHEDHTYFDPNDKQRVGAATFLLSREAQAEVSVVVLEGAPGQGKSTLTQYICQVHRMHLLGRKDELQQISESHRDSAVRLPLRVDLRDFATWQAKRDPFTVGGQVQQWSKSLESFLAALIRYSSGGAEFDVSDFQALAKISSLLVVLDGLDEIADVAARSEVVEEIRGFVTRVSVLAASLQLIVTSRPAAFANSPGLRGEPYTRLTLGSLSKDLILEYGRRWTNVRRIDAQDRVALLSILESKLGQPHLRDLARNPMQLTILLSLIHSRGATLPDKRTALYDAYMDLFFSREGEKSQVVRECRELLIGVHRHVAWLIHAEAEAGESSGRMSEERLKQVVREYLEEDGHDPSVADRLFAGVVERVVALVSRVQGTFEFEVQPLREYFAARYLYDTAPNSPVGSERSGSKPDRFAALSRNFYWLNVTRFYAGCYSKGELASLIDGLRELKEEEPYKLLVYPQLLALNLLTDWVFSQHPRSAKEVARIIFDSNGLRQLQTQSRADFEPLKVGDNSARLELMELCWKKIEDGSSLHTVRWLSYLISVNSERIETSDRWLEGMKKHPRDVRWLYLGSILDHLKHRSVDELQTFTDFTDFAHCQILGDDNPTLLDIDETLRQTTIRGILDGGTLSFQPRAPSLLQALSRTLEPFWYAQAFRHRSPQSLSDSWSRHYELPQIETEVLPVSDMEQIHRFIQLSKELWKRPTVEWATSLTPWSILVEAGRSIFGECWALCRIAVTASGIRSTTESSNDCDELFDSSLPLCKRARYARLRAGNAKWWQARLSEATSDSQRLFALMLVFGWASARIIGMMLSSLDGLLADITARQWHVLYSAVRSLVACIPNRDGRTDNALATLPTMSERCAALLTARAGQSGAVDIYRRWLRNTADEDVVLQATLEIAVDCVVSHKEPTEDDLAFIRRAYRHVGAEDAYSPHWYPRSDRLLDRQIALSICKSPDEYPHMLLGLAQECIKATSPIHPVMRVADNEQWFSRQYPTMRRR